LRERLDELMRSVGMRAKLFPGPDGILESGMAATVRCLLMDIRMRGMNGLDFQARLKRHNIQTPVVFMTSHGDIQMAVRAMKAGAVDFLTKPLREQDVLDAVAAALDRERELRQRAQAIADLQTRLASLTRREGQIMLLATAGLMNKQIAGELGLSEVTVKMHRANMMRKMSARTLAALVRMAAALNLPLPDGVVVWPEPDTNQLPARRGVTAMRRPWASAHAG
jgi:FixJ family two-component response regulator